MFVKFFKISALLLLFKDCKFSFLKFASFKFGLVLKFRFLNFVLNVGEFALFCTAVFLKFGAKEFLFKGLNLKLAKFNLEICLQNPTKSAFLQKIFIGSKIANLSLFSLSCAVCAFVSVNLRFKFFAQGFGCFGAIFSIFCAILPFCFSLFAP